MRCLTLLAKLAIVGLLLGGAGSGCSTVGRGGEAPPHVIVAEDGGEEEVLSPDDELTRERDDKPTTETKAGELLVVLGFVGSIIASALLPLLLFL